jgi:hypothetical protein
MDTSRFDDLPPREAAARAWFDLRDHTYAITRLNQCVEPSEATKAVLAAYWAHDAIAMDGGFWKLRTELRKEGVAI